MKEIKIFIVEDDSIFINIFSDLIDAIQKEYDDEKINVKLNIKTFYSVKEASFELRQNPEIIIMDYYLTDDNLKPMTSDKLLEDIKSSGKDVKVIAVTGEDDPDIVDSLKEKGASFYISKSPKTFYRIKPTLKLLIDKIIED